jgi:hypothetical protein
MASFRSISLTLSTLLLLVPAVGFGDPPAHAPAHGRRAKEHHGVKSTAPSGGLQVVFDSGLGLHVAVGLPGVYFQAGNFYRHSYSGWQVSSTGKGGWSVAAWSGVPESVRKTHPGSPAKAKGHPGAKHGKHKGRK